MAQWARKLRARAIWPVLLAATGLVAAGPVLAQESTIEKEERKEKSAVMDEMVYKRLSAVHELIGDKNNAEALDKLRTIEKMRLNDYEKALVYQAYGYVYINQNDTKRAIQFFEKALEMDSMPNFAQQGMLYSLAGLYAGEERYRDSVRLLTEWFRYEQEPKPDAHIMMASSYFELKEYDNALPWVQEAIAKQAASDGKPRDSWYQLELAIYFEKKQYRKAAEILRRMIALWPNESKNWKTLSGVYVELEDDNNALAVMDVAYRYGHLTEEKELMNLVRLNLYLELPYEAGSMLAREMKAGRIPKTVKNLELLKTAWSSAREYDRAIATIDELAPLADTGKFYLEKAQLLAEKTEWSDAAAAAREALDKGGLKKPGDAWLLLGMTLAEAGRYDQAVSALRQAKKYKENDANKRAQGWLEYVADRRAAAGG